MEIIKGLFIGAALLGKPVLVKKERKGVYNFLIGPITVFIYDWDDSHTIVGIDGPEGSYECYKIDGNVRTVLHYLTDINDNIEIK